MCTGHLCSCCSVRRDPAGVVSGSCFPDCRPWLRGPVMGLSCVLPGTSVKILGKGAHTREAWSWGVGGALSWQHWFLCCRYLHFRMSFQHLFPKLVLWLAWLKNEKCNFVIFADKQSSSLLWNIDINFMLKVGTHFFKNRKFQITKAVFSHLLGHILVSESPVLF